MDTGKEVKSALISILCMCEKRDDIKEILWGLDWYQDDVMEFSDRHDKSNEYQKNSDNPCKEIVATILRYPVTLKKMVTDICLERDREYRLNGAGLKLYTYILDGVKMVVGGDQAKDYDYFVYNANSYLECSGLKEVHK